MQRKAETEFELKNLSGRMKGGRGSVLVMACKSVIGILLMKKNKSKRNKSKFMS